MRYPADHKRETRERVLAEAAERIRAHGPLGIGVAEVTKRAGLTPGGLYAHFTSKDSLIAAGIAKRSEGARVRWQGATETRDAKSGLAAYIQSYLSPKHRDARGKCCPIAALSSELPRMPNACRLAYAEGTRNPIELIAHALPELGHRDADALANSVIAELVGAQSTTKRDRMHCSRSRAARCALVSDSSHTERRTSWAS